ncbi:hypothetical protein AZ54_04950 [Xanthomonas oryzae pv. oryzae PXO86]|nr:hypothetical protein AZ54_04950 [Xanthomonas oryzae pv. oryzae PXO86]
MCRIVHVLHAFFGFAGAVTKLKYRITTMRGACLQV